MDKAITWIGNVLGLSPGTTDLLLLVFGIVSGGLAMWAFMRRYITRIEQLVNFHRGVNHDKIVMNGGIAIIGGKVWRRSDDELNIGDLLSPDQIALARRSVMKDGPLAGIAVFSTADQDHGDAILATLGNKASRVNNPDHVRERTGVDHGTVPHALFLTLEHHTNTPAGVLEKWRLEVTTLPMADFMHSTEAAGIEFGEKKLGTNWVMHKAATHVLRGTSAEDEALARRIFCYRNLPTKAA